MSFFPGQGDTNDVLAHRQTGIWQNTAIVGWRLEHKQERLLFDNGLVQFGHFQASQNNTTDIVRIRPQHSLDSSWNFRPGWGGVGDLADIWQKTKNLQKIKKYNFGTLDTLPQASGHKITHLWTLFVRQRRIFCGTFPLEYTHMHAPPPKKTYTHTHTHTPHKNGTERLWNSIAAEIETRHPNVSWILFQQANIVSIKPHKNWERLACWRSAITASVPSSQHTVNLSPQPILQRKPQQIPSKDLCPAVPEQFWPEKILVQRRLVRRCTSWPVSQSGRIASHNKNATHKKRVVYTFAVHHWSFKKNKTNKKKNRKWV